MNVRELEDALFVAFPREDAESWDHVGLSVGDPAAPVERVFVALDATTAMVEAAHAAQCNVLLAHHPVYLKAPGALVPQAGPCYQQAAAAAYQAARWGINILSYHTNLDRSRAAQALLPSLLGLTALHSLEHPAEPERTGLGSVADVPATTLSELAAQAANAFHTSPRVWGDPKTPVTRCAFLGGSLGDLGEAALAAGAQAVICGEAGYHVCQDLAARGLCVILLGHDASEYPFTRILADAATAAGVAPASIVYADAPHQWWTMTKGGRA